MKEAKFYKKLKNRIVQCELCPVNCVINDGQRGNCHVRKNISGKLYSMVYGRPSAVAIDPIEKKPLFHFLPETRTYSIGTAGCNFNCTFCQNYTLSQYNEEEIGYKELSPERAVEEAQRNKCKSISYTYNEPTIFWEYVYDIAKIAKRKGLKNIMITNGYINLEPLKKLYPLIDAVNVDMKGNTEFYNKLCRGDIEIVKRNLIEIKKIGCHIEITNLLIPGYNDTDEEIEDMASWILENLGKDTPLHLSRFFPLYKMAGLKATPIATLERAKKIALNYLNKVYIGNI